MKTLFTTLAIVFICMTCLGQNYTSYFTGNTENIETNPEGGLCMMGGATEHNEAMKWFLNRANGGDILVLRASGSDGYNDYMYSELGVSVNSVETIVFDNGLASNSSYVQESIANAEAIWFAGGDQWNYVSFWRDTPIATLINEGLEDRNIVIGGTSAGMAILGQYYFTAENGTVTSDQALSNPYNFDMAIGSEDFLHNNYLQNTITDSHYDDPDRKGRHVTFMARIITDHGVNARGIACNEYTAVCIDADGLATVFGEYPAYEEAAYFIQTNCELETYEPENCSANEPLNWNLGTQALKVYKVYGTDFGDNTFDLSDWQTGNGGNWENWYVIDGSLFQEEGNEPDCTLSTSNYLDQIELSLYPNPVFEKLNVNATEKIVALKVTNTLGKTVWYQTYEADLYSGELDFSKFPSGLYLLNIEFEEGHIQRKIVK